MSLRDYFFYLFNALVNSSTKTSHADRSNDINPSNKQTVFSTTKRNEDIHLEENKYEETTSNCQQGQNAEISHQSEAAEQVF
jgi:hypothetical protein